MFPVVFDLFIASFSGLAGAFSTAKRFKCVDATVGSVKDGPVMTQQGSSTPTGTDIAYSKSHVPGVNL